MARELAADRRADRARINQNRARGDGFEDTVFPEDHLFRGGAVTDNGHHDAGPARGLGGRCGNARSGALERLRLRLRAVVNAQPMAAFQQVHGHRLAHDAGSNESD